MDHAIARVPGTTSNLGPGYDCLGLALGLYNEVSVARRRGRRDAHDMADAAAEAFFRAAEVRPFAFDWAIRGDVPISRGLGSSVTLRLGVMAGLNVLAGGPLSRQALFEQCSALEGHPDNAAPATFGGFNICGPGGGQPLRTVVDPRLQFVLLIPDFEIRTTEARRLLPATIDRLAAVRSSGRACRVTAAFVQQDYAALRGQFLDEAFHEPHRQPLIPCLREVIAAGEAAGALGGFLSGSGSTICCLTLKSPQRVATAMLQAAGMPGAKAIVALPDNRGLVVKAVKEIPN
ncbi:MAG: homoserine kinase [Verrucomicrobia bacterium]|nr:homoserine kinase [Verrucomicrobiota bacterium]